MPALNPRHWDSQRNNVSRAVAREILLRHPGTSVPPPLRTRLALWLASLQRALRPKSEPPLPFAGVRAPLHRGPGPRSSGIALREP